MGQLETSASLEAISETLGVSLQELDYWEHYEIGGLQLGHWDIESPSQPH